jgi:hypothetical protein
MLVAILVVVWALVVLVVACLCAEARRGDVEELRVLERHHEQTDLPRDERFWQGGSQPSLQRPDAAAQQSRPAPRTGPNQVL